MKYFDFELPTEDEMDTMTVEELIKWRDKLAPYYADRWERVATRTS